MATAQSSKVHPGALGIGAYIVHLAMKAESPVTNKKLQKLVYYAQAWSLVLRDKKLFSEPIEAWVHGPAVRSIYKKYKNFGFEPISEDGPSSVIQSIEPEVAKLLSDVWCVYGKFDAAYLELLTHKEQPWQQARRGLPSGANSTNVITQDSMKQYYSKKLADSTQSK